MTFDTRGAPVADSASSRWIRWALFLASVAAVALRYPDIFLEPRLWGEEGTIYLHDALVHPWYATLLAPAQGYLALTATVPTTLAAHVVPLEYAPQVTTGCAFVLQGIPLALIVWGRAPIWSTAASRLIGLAIVLLNPLSEDTWLATNVLQFHFALVALLILLEPVELETTRTRWLHRGLLVLAGVSGPTACTLLPLFFVSAMYSRQREAFVRMATLGVVTAIQLAIVKGHMTSDVGADLRFSGLDVATVASAALAKSVLVPFMGLDYGTSLAVVMDRARAAGPDAPRLLGLVCALFLGGALFFAGRRATTEQRLVFLGAFMVLILAAMYLGIGDRRTWVYPDCAGRYFYVPGVALLFLLLAQLDLRPGALSGIHQSVVAAVLALALATQARDWNRRIISRSGAPHWRREVASWRADPDHRLGVWPAGWSFQLPPTR